MYATYGNIYHQYTPNVSIYTSTMDPMGIGLLQEISRFFAPSAPRKLRTKVASSLTPPSQWVWLWPAVMAPWNWDLQSEQQMHANIFSGTSSSTRFEECSAWKNCASIEFYLGQNATFHLFYSSSGTRLVLSNLPRCWIAGSWWSAIADVLCCVWSAGKLAWETGSTQGYPRQHRRKQAYSDIWCVKVALVVCKTVVYPRIAFLNLFNRQLTWWPSVGAGGRVSGRLE